MNSKIKLTLVLLSTIFMVFSCSMKYSYLPPPDAELSTGHLVVFFNELYSTEHPEPGSAKAATLTIIITQSGKNIITHQIEAGEWGLYPVPEGVFTVNYEIEFLDQSIPLNRSYTSNIETINAINIDFWRIEPIKLDSDVQTKKAVFTGKTVNYVLDAKRQNKALDFATLQKMQNTQK